MKFSKDIEERLEFNEIRVMVSDFASSETTRKRLLETQPMDKSDVLAEHHAQVREFLDILKFDTEFPIQPFEDVRPFIRHLQPEGASLQPNHYLEILKLLEMVRNIKAFSGSNQLRYKQLATITHQMFYFPELVREIGLAIELSGIVKDTASPALNQIRKEIRGKESQIRGKIHELARKYTEHLVDDLMTQRNGRHVLAVKSERASQVQGVVHDYSGSGQTVYIEPHENIAISTQLQKAYAEEKKEINRILIALGNHIRPHIADLIENYDVLIRIDVLHAKASYGKKLRGCLPEMNLKNQSVYLKKAYHPILLKNHPRSEIIPTTIQMGEKESKIVLISGPNAGGKTVTLKTVGLLSLMFQSAIPIPCDEKSYLPIYHKLFCDIGDKQSIANDLSTFSSHLVRIKEILAESSVDALVLIDELGTGTDPAEGSALAQAVLNDLLSKQSNVIATTHLGELKLYANDKVGVQNASMEFDEEHLTSTFRLVQGIPGSSYAFFISKRLGLPHHIIEEGKSFVGDQRNTVESLLNKLNQQVFEAEQLRNELDVKTARAASLEKMYETKLERLKKFETDTKEKALKEADQMLAGVNKQIENTVSEIKTANAEKEKVKQAREAIDKLKQQVKGNSKKLIQQKLSNIKVSFQVGDRIRHTSFGTIGEIIEFDGKRSEYVIQAGAMTMRVTKDQIELVEARKQERKQKVKHSFVGGDYSNEQVSNEIDLRGLTFEEAWDKCDVYLDHALMTGWETIGIIHGKGTGALRQKINDQLRHDKRVKTKRFGNEGEGSTGVTIVTLRK